MQTVGALLRWQKSKQFVKWMKLKMNQKNQAEEHAELWACTKVDLGQGE